MNTLYMKIQAFDEGSYSLLVSFASDTTKSQNPDNYPAYAYQPMNMWPDIKDPAEIELRIAAAGVYIAEQQTREEQFVEDPQQVAMYQSMVGQEKSYPISELIPPPPEDPVIEV